MTLNRIKIQRGIPTMLYCDNGSELKLQTIFEDEWVIVPRCAIPLVALEESTMREKISRSRYVPVGSISGFRESYVPFRHPSADVLHQWPEKHNFAWLDTEDLLAEYK